MKISLSNDAVSEVLLLFEDWSETLSGSYRRFRDEMEGLARQTSYQKLWDTLCGIDKAYFEKINGQLRRDLLDIWYNEGNSLQDQTASILAGPATEEACRRIDDAISESLFQLRLSPLEPVNFLSGQVDVSAAEMEQARQAAAAMEARLEAWGEELCRQLDRRAEDNGLYSYIRPLAAGYTAGVAAFCSEAARRMAELAEHFADRLRQSAANAQESSEEQRKSIRLEDIAEDLGFLGSLAGLGFGKGKAGGGSGSGPRPAVKPSDASGIPGNYTKGQDKNSRYFMALSEQAANKLLAQAARDFYSEGKAPYKDIAYHVDGDPLEQMMADFARKDCRWVCQEHEQSLRRHDRLLEGRRDQEKQAYLAYLDQEWTGKIWAKYNEYDQKLFVLGIEYEKKLESRWNSLNRKVERGLLSSEAAEYQYVRECDLWNTKYQLRRQKYWDKIRDMEEEKAGDIFRKGQNYQPAASINYPSIEAVSIEELPHICRGLLNNRYAPLTMLKGAKSSLEKEKQKEAEALQAGIGVAQAEAARKAAEDKLKKIEKEKCPVIEKDIEEARRTCEVPCDLIYRIYGAAYLREKETVRGFYSPALNRIVIRDKGPDASGVLNIKTPIHEYIHYMSRSEKGMGFLLKDASHEELTTQHAFNEGTTEMFARMYTNTLRDSFAAVKNEYRIINCPKAGTGSYGYQISVMKKILEVLDANGQQGEKFLRQCFMDNDLEALGEKLNCILQTPSEPNPWEVIKQKMKTIQEFYNIDDRKCETNRQEIIDLLRRGLGGESGNP